MNKLVKSFAIFVLCSLHLSYSVADSDISGTWTNDSGSFQFLTNGQASIQWSNGTQLQGQWQLNDQHLYIMTNNGPMQFVIQQQNQMLILTDQQGSYQFQRQAMSHQQASLPPAAAPSMHQPPTNTGLMSDAEYVQFLRAYPQQNAQFIYQQLQRMNPNQLQNFDIWGALGSDIYTRLCKGGYTQIVWQGSMNGSANCQQLIMWEQQAMQFGGSGQEADFQRSQVINMMRCSTGETDRKTCQTYQSTLKGYHQGTNETMKVINKGFEAPPCTQYYDDQNVYLGCW